MPPSPPQQLECVDLGGDESLKPSDCVLIRAESSSSGQPQAAKVLGITKGSDGRVRLQLCWFYTPEQAVGGRKPFHGDKELFLTDQVEAVPLAAVACKVRVLPLAKYQVLEHVAEHDYFARLTYKPVQQEFEPPRVPVFCRCELPYNPDRFMVQCAACLEWYHPECLRTSMKALAAQSHWTCPDCVSTRQAAPLPGGRRPA